MLVLITASPRGQECATALQHATGERVSVVSNPPRTNSESADLAMLPNAARAIVIDEAFLDLWPGSEDELLVFAEEVPAIFVNMAISGISRIVQSVRHSLQRYDREQLSATLAAESMLRSELTGSVTGILLNAQLALQTPSLPENAAMNMREVYSLALNLKARLQHRQDAASHKKTNGRAIGKSI